MKGQRVRGREGVTDGRERGREGDGGRDREMKGEEGGRWCV